MISYAQNFEDVLLERCFRDVQHGFYIDIGAWDPRHDSVTNHFYLKGWSGINVEPSLESYDALVAERPRDTNLRVVLGSSESEAVAFHDFRGGGISTLRSFSDAYVDNLSARGFSQRTVDVPMTTLARVCTEHVPEGQTIHFLKVDVEGWEEDVLRGHDWNRWRPHVLVVESITPVSFDEASGRDVYEDLSSVWEQFVLDQRYLFAIHDGVNRFYVREESAALLELLRVPVNTLDQAAHYQDHERREQLANAERQLEQVADQVRAQTCRIAELEAAIARVSAELETQVRRVAELESSTSWRVTGPLRSLGHLRRAAVRHTSGSADRIQPHSTGINVIGHFSDTSGLAEATRSTARCVEAAGLPLSTVEVGPVSPLGEGFERAWSEHSLRYEVTVVHDNIAHAADDASHYARRAASDMVVGYWYWELADLPSTFLPHFDMVDEVWVPSRFVHDALRPHTEKPITIVPPSLDFRPPDAVERTSFGLPEDRFLFLTMASVDSVLERKNPLGVLHAFEQAFSQRDPVGLVVKITGLDRRPDVAEVFKDAADRCALYLLDDRLSRSATMNLMASVDAYVSLHRAEGFGLPIAEAMALCKPVVATSYSGNQDFTSAETAFLVPYELVELTSSHAVYPAGFQWADPDIAAAAAQLRSVAFDELLRTQIAAAGRSHVRARCDPSVGGRVIRSRILALGRLSS